MTENETQGITRRDLLKRGAVLGGAVVWATPVVQTLGMGRAYANTASPVGKDISYIGINVTDCTVNDAPFFAKWEDGDWEDKPGAAPECADKEDLAPGVESGGKDFDVSWSGGECANLFVPLDYQNCTVVVWVKGGSSQSTDEPCRTYTNADLVFGAWNEVCTATPST
jgi:hypothetical protein